MAWIYQITDQIPGFSSSDYENNADKFADYFSGYMTAASMAGIFGNIQYESYLNPGQQELYRGGDTRYGYGFIQWTPASSFLSWCNVRGLTWYDGDTQCYRIKCEGEKTDGCGGLWFPKNGYNYTWAQFCQLNDYEEAANAYFWERERGSWSDLRIEYAENWYDYLENHVPIPDPGPTPPEPGPTPPQVSRHIYGGVRDLMRRGVISNGKL